MDILSSWFLIALISPMIYSVINIADMEFFGSEAYENHYDGTIISGIFSILPWLIFPLFLASSVQLAWNQASVGAVIAGFVFICSTFFYFKALFAEENPDGTLVEIIWNLTVIVTPIMAFFLIGEKLSFEVYIAVLLVFFACLLLGYNSELSAERNLKKIFLIMVPAIIFLSLSMIIEEEVYKKISFLSGFLFFSLGSFLAGLFFLCLRKIKIGKKLLFCKRKLSTSVLRNWKKFLAVELLSVSAVFFHELSIDKAPAVSLISTVDSFQPMMIPFLYLFLFLILWFLNKKTDRAKSMLRSQLVGWKVKLVAIGIFVFSAFLIR